MFFEALDLLNIRSSPSLDAGIDGQMLAGEVGRETEPPRDGWHRLEILANFFPPRSGWVLEKKDDADLLREVEAPPRSDFTLWAFLKTAVETEIRFNQAGRGVTPFFIVADYLIAWADIASKLKNIVTKDPRADGVGPFQISSGDWSRFCQSVPGSEFVAEDRNDGLAQLSGAAFLALESMMAISRAVAAHDLNNNDGETSGDAGPFVPSYVDVLVASLFSNDFAIAVRLAKLDEHGGTSTGPLLATAFGDRSEKVAAYRQDLARASNGDFETVDGLLMKAEALLTDELAKALKLMADNIPEDLPKTDGTAPWRPIALAEEARWLTEHIPDRPDIEQQTVGTYLAAAGLDPGKMLPWCGAFAAFCIKAASDPFSGTVVRQPARAASWAEWGNIGIPLAQKDVPQGAIVVVAPEKGSGRSGHVGFFERYFDPDQTSVEILGGNQSGKVTKTKFARSKIVAIRWFSPMASREDQFAREQIAGLKKQNLSRLLSLISQLESNNNPNAVFGKSGNQDAPRLTSMTVGEVIAWQRSFVAGGSPSSASGQFQFLRKTLSGLRDDGMVNTGTTFDAATQVDLAIALMSRRGLGRFLAGSLSAEDFALSLAKEWASLPVPKTVRRGSRTVRAGQSYYAGDSLNRALVSVEAYMSAIRSVLQ